MAFTLAIRRWQRRPGLAIVAVLVLSLGIGATTAMFSIVHAVLLQEEPWPAAERLVRIYGVLPPQRTNPAAATTWNRGGMAWASWRELQTLPHFEDVVAWVPGDHIVGDDRTELVRAFYASSTLPQMLGARPAQGRFFTADEDEVDSGAVVISHALWQRLFGGDPDVVGKLTNVTPPGGSPAVKIYRRTIAGVLPESFVFPGGTPDVLIPIGFHKYNGSFGTPFFLALARLAPDASLDAAAAATEPIVRREQTPDRRTSRLVTLREERIGYGDRPLWLMFAGAALLLVVACANVAGLLLSDARSRQHETAVRCSLGGTRVAILRQLMAEHAVLACAAATGGVLLARWFIPSLVALAPAGLVGEQTVALDREIAAWAVAVAVVTTMIAGLVPAMAMSSTTPGDAMKTAGREVSPGGRWRHRAIVAAQFGLALVLLVGAGLFGETLLRLGREPLGFSPDGVAVVAVTRDRESPQGQLTPAEREHLMQLRKTGGGAALSRFLRDRTWVPMQALIDRLGATAGVGAVAVADSVPFTPTVTRSVRARVEGQAPDQAIPLILQSVTAPYFDAMGIRMLRGSTVDAAVRTGVVISETAARQLFDGGAIGRRLAIDTLTYDIVGVAADVKQRGLLDDGAGAVYFPLGSAEIVRYIVVRTAAESATMMPQLKQAIETSDAPLFVTSMSRLGDLVGSTIVVERSRAMLAGLYGGAALLLASVGLYGLAARLVAERRREIGIRVALGAGRRDVRRLVMADAWLIVGLGLVSGLPAAIVLSRFAQGMLYGVAPAAPHVLTVAAVALTLAAVSATVIPAARANRIDPARTLREE